METVSPVAASRASAAPPTVPPESRRLQGDAIDAVEEMATKRPEDVLAGGPPPVFTEQRSIRVQGAAKDAAGPSPNDCPRRPAKYAAYSGFLGLLILSFRHPPHHVVNGITDWASMTHHHTMGDTRCRYIYTTTEDTK